LFGFKESEFREGLSASKEYEFQGDISNPNDKECLSGFKES